MVEKNIIKYYKFVLTFLFWLLLLVEFCLAVGRTKLLPLTKYQYSSFEGGDEGRFPPIWETQYWVVTFSKQDGGEISDTATYHIWRSETRSKGWREKWRKRRRRQEGEKNATFTRNVITYVQYLLHSSCSTHNKLLRLPRTTLVFSWTI